VRTDRLARVVLIQRDRVRKGWLDPIDIARTRHR
jgi:hypothetical protein